MVCFAGIPGTRTIGGFSDSCRCRIFYAVRIAAVRTVNDSGYVALLLLVVQPLQVKAQKTDYQHDYIVIHGYLISLRCRNTV